MLLQRTAIQPPTNVAPGVKRNPESTQRWSVEKTTAEIGRIMADKDFASLDDANAFLKKYMAQRNAETSWGMKPNEMKARLGMPVAEAEQSDAERAQDIMYDAWGAKDEKRVELAREALKICSDCADAYILLAQETAANLEEAKNLYEKALEAGKKSFGEAAPDEEEPYMRLEARPFFRAKAGLASTLWLLGERDAAIAHLQEILPVNKMDNLAVRYQLMNWLIIADRDDDIEKLKEMWPGDRWLYGEALHAFKKHGDTKQAYYKLRLAWDDNKDIVPLLLGREEMPEMMPALVGMGDHEEAIEYVSIAKEAWSSVPGALEWLARDADKIAALRKGTAFRLWETRMLSAVRELDQGRFNKAKGDLMYAKKQAEKFGEDRYELCQTLSKLAYVLADVDLSAEHEPIFRGAAELTEEIYGPTHDYLGADLFHLSIFLTEHKQYDEAEQVLLRARAISENTDNGHFISSVLTQLSKVYKGQGKDLLAKQTKAEGERIHAQMHEDGHDHSCGHH